MKVFVLNCGSSSIKFQLFDMVGKGSLAKGSIERIGNKGTTIKCVNNEGMRIDKECDILDHVAGIRCILQLLLSSEMSIIASPKEIDAIGHRVVHGGEQFSEPVRIDTDTIAGIKACIPMAPLHNPANLEGIIACQKIFPGTPQVAVFDTAFHHSIPPEAYLYGLPYDLYKKYGLRKYGFHGISHSYVAHKAAEILKKPIETLKIVTCHLGNGASVAAIKYGKSIDTSMGFTPLDGLVMGTRCGEIDPAIIPFLMYKEDMTGHQVYDYLNKKSGLLGLSGISGDFRDVETAAIAGDKQAILALETVVYRIKKYIGCYTVAMGGIDILIFTAGIGEHSPFVREKICEGLEVLGVFIDKESNNKNEEDTSISKKTAKVKIMMLATNEELVIAEETCQLCKGKNLISSSLWGDI